MCSPLVDGGAMTNLRWSFAVVGAAGIALVLVSSQFAAGARSRSPMFKTPSGNIVCAYYNLSLRCDIRNGLSPKPSRPRGCPSYTDFGQGLEIGSRRASVVYGGET